MKKITYKLILTMLICITVLISLTTVFAAAEESATTVEAERVIEEETLEDMQTEEYTEIMTDTVEETESVSLEDGGISWGSIGKTLSDFWDMVVSHRNTILSALAAAVSALSTFIVQRAFKPTVKNLDKKYKEFMAASKKEMDEMRETVGLYCKKVQEMLDDYSSEKTKKHASDAFAQICHEQSLLLHKVLVQSSLSMSLKEEADRIYADSENAINTILTEKTKGGDSVDA